MITKTCRISGEKFTITDKDLEFYKKMEVPPPTLCPEERSRRRMTWANQRHLYHRTCDGTGKKIVTNISPDKNLKVFDIQFWYSDNWEPLATGRDFDFSRPFFQQFEELMQVSPIPNLQRSPEYDENSDFTNYAGKNKNCYLIFDSDKSWDCYYAYSINSCQNTMDCFRCSSCELCYECIDSQNCYDSKFLQNCNHCSNAAFLKNCIGCKHCFGCVNLRNKEYYFNNEPCTKETYEQKIKDLQLDNYDRLQEIRGHFTEFSKTFPQKFLQGVQNEDVLGDYLENCKNAQYCFDCRNLWDCSYVTQAFDDAKNAMDCTEIGDESEWLYECAYAGYNAHFNRFTTHCLGSVSDMMYCFYTPFCENCFGCMGLHHKKYCIFNKQYSEAEYKALVPKIIEHMQKTGEWGEFFPIEISPYGYNETHAFEYFPLTKEEALSRGYKWKDETLGVKYEGPITKAPPTITEVDESICDKILTCEVSGKNYRIVKAELDFYKKMQLPIPRICPEERHINRVKLRNPRKLYHRNCDQCGTEIQTTMDPKRPEEVYCEKCYLKAVD